MTISGPLVARNAAADIVGRVLRSGAYSNVILGAVTGDMTPADGSRTKALTYGVLRFLEPINRAIENGAGRSVDDIEDEIIDSLRVSAFELMYSNTPLPVAVSAGVDMVRGRRAKAAGFANAVLRRVSEQSDPPETIEIPDWLTNSLTEAWGAEDVEQFATASTAEPARIMRGPTGHSEALSVEGVPGAFEAEPGPLPEGFVVQDAASIAVGNAVAAGPGMSVADLAAAPGGKTAHLLNQVGSSGYVVALDRHPRRVSDARKRVPGADWIVGDGTRLPLRKASFDRVLLDAPCSGLGTLRRRPEIRFRIEPDDVERLADLQARLLEASLELVAPGGTLVYSVCTVTPEETVSVIEPYGFEPADVPGRTWGKGTLMAPHITGTDGMFVAVHRG